MLLQDKVVVVSGVGRGLGRSIAVQSARAGADVVPASRTESHAETAETIDLRKLPEPDEIADAVDFFASHLAWAITGACLDVNGGEYHH
jgi:NAD(P)-dependent dehydrogenase (short-subunit alcohol dehydrogenase family)